MNASVILSFVLYPPVLQNIVVCCATIVLVTDQLCVRLS